jgi:hypothetical protein
VRTQVVALDEYNIHIIYYIHTTYIHTFIHDIHDIHVCMYVIMRVVLGPALDGKGYMLYVCMYNMFMTITDLLSTNGCIGSTKTIKYMLYVCRSTYHGTSTMYGKGIKQEGTRTFSP